MAITKLLLLFENWIAFTLCNFKNICSRLIWLQIIRRSYFYAYMSCSTSLTKFIKLLQRIKFSWGFSPGCRSQSAWCCLVPDSSTWWRHKPSAPVSPRWRPSWGALFSRSTWLQRPWWQRWLVWLPPWAAGCPSEKRALSSISRQLSPPSSPPWSRGFR